MSGRFHELADADAFESYCASLCATLELGAPVHLAAGADRGKDLVTATRLHGESRVFRIHVECKYYGDRSVGLAEVYPKWLWAIASKIDILLLMTNSRLSANAADWLEQTQRQRSFAVAVWDGEYLSWLAGAVSGAEISRAALVERVHGQLAAQWHAHQEQRRAPKYDGQLNCPQFVEAPVKHRYFVNRDRELEALSALGNYKTALVTGPPGVGKTVLCNAALLEASNADFPVFQADLAQGERDSFRALILPLARTLSSELGEPKLVDHLTTYGWENPQDILRLAKRELRGNSLFALVENVHTIQADERTLDALASLFEEPGESHLLMTSRAATTPPGIVPDLHLRLEGFQASDVEAYLRKRELPVDRSVVDGIVAQHRGWPIALSLACCGAAARREQDAAEVLDAMRQASEHTSRYLQRLVDSLDTPARRVLRHVVLLLVSLTKAELTLVTQLSRAEFAEAWEELIQVGFVQLETSRVGSNTIHELIKPHLVSTIDDQGAINRKLANFLRTFDDDSERLLAACDHLISAEDYADAADLLAKEGETLVRTGRISETLKLLAEFPDGGLQEERFLRNALLRARCLEIQSRVAEAVDTLATFFYPEALDRLSPLLVCQFQCQQARNLYFFGRYDEASDLLDAALGSLEKQDQSLEKHDPVEVLRLKARCHSLLARIAYARRRLNDARELYLRADSAYETAGDLIGRNEVRHRLAMVMRVEGRLNEALREFEAVRREARRLKDAKREAYALHRIGEVSRLRGDLDRAKRCHQDSLSLKQALGHRRGFVYSYQEQAKIALEEGALDEALAKLREALAIVEQLGMPKERATTLFLLGRVEHQRGAVQEASSWFRTAAQEFEEIGLPRRATAVRERAISELDSFD